MTTKLTDLYTHHHGMHGKAHPVEECIYRASVADLVAALIAEGGEIREAEPDSEVPSLGDIEDVTPGRYLVFRIPADET